MQYAGKKLFNKDVPLSSLTSEELDRFAWEAICNWPSKAGMDVIHEGFDYSELTRWYLWDKVGRAIRKAVNPEDFNFEAGLLGYKSNLQKKQPRIKKSTFSFITKMLNKNPGSFIDNATRGIYNFGASIRLKMLAYHKRGRILFAPIPSDRLEGSIKQIIKSRSSVVVVPPLTPISYPGAFIMHHPYKVAEADNDYAEQLHTGIQKGLKSFGIKLLSEDIDLLRNQIFNQAQHIKLVEAQIKAIKPKAILVHGDNHPLHQHYVLVARREGIPSIMLQHGLDCERFYIDEAYASYIAVWGKARKDRYRQDSKWQPVIEVTGNPEFDDLQPPNSINTAGNYWLWVTRPHTSDKCYSPSRYPYEGIEILKSLLEALDKARSAKLVIKPHPFDYIDLYSEYITSSAAADRVEVTNDNIQNLIPNASVVISEDSTAAMEAMFWGKIVVFAHFTKSQPVTPFADYGAALPAFTADMMHESMHHAGLMTSSELKKMLNGQRAFMDDFAGHYNDNASRRVEYFIDNILRESNS